MHGHITSLAVARTHRKLGLATKLMSAAREHAAFSFRSKFPCPQMGTLRQVLEPFSWAHSSRFPILQTRRWRRCLGPSTPRCMCASATAALSTSTPRPSSTSERGRGGCSCMHACCRAPKSSLAFVWLPLFPMHCVPSHALH